LADAVRAAAVAALPDLGLDPSVLPDAVSVERPRHPEHGDYASALALQVGRKAGVPPRELAQAIVRKLSEDPAIQSVAIAGPGFLNIRLSPAAAGAVAGIVVEQGDAYGHGSALAGQRVNLEFVSANPTGPLHIGGVRWAAVGDALARLLRAEGADATSEYYFNDVGAQIDRFASSLLAASRHENPPGRRLHRRVPQRHRRQAGQAAPLPRDDSPLDETGRARLWLAEATRIVLATGLGLLGVTAPDRL
jgi:arginyl-tRNA synthetase